MSSYFDFYCKNVSKDKAEDLELIKGTCYSMCPQDEANLRVRENLVHVLEVLGSSRKLVKSYSRSAADSHMAVPRLLRPYTVLKDTVQYLLLEVLKRQDVSVLVLYNFVDDRLRAVRQDMTIQRLPSDQCASLLEPIIRFYVYFGCRLRNYPINDYDPVLNKKHLLESLKWFLCCCDNMEKNTNNKEVENLNTILSNLKIGEKSLSYDRALMESVYLLCNLGDSHPLLRYLELSKDLKTNPQLDLAFKITIANLKGNYIVVFRLIEKLCPIAFCAICPLLPSLQRRALLVLSHAYSSKQLCVPAAALQRWLRLGSAREALAACAHYGLAALENNVRFSKADFKTDVPLHQSTLNLKDDQKICQNIEDIFITCR